MKIAITADGNNLKSKVDQRFGRCKYFIIANVEDGKIQSYQVIENQGVIQGHGAGIKAAQQIGNLNVEAVITGQLGPNATTVLEEIGIKTYTGAGIISECISQFIDNKLEPIIDIAEPHAQVQTNQNSEKIFFPLLENKGLNSEISQHFGHAPFFGLYDVSKKEFKVISNNLDHTDPTKSPIDQIQEAVNPTIIFAKGIGGRAIQIIQQKGLCLKTGNFRTVGEAIENLDSMVEQTQSCGHEHNH